MSGVLVTTFYPIQNAATGGKRRVDALIQALQPDVFLLQPAPAHPDFPGRGYPLDLGRRRIGINWGMFNLYCPRNRRAARQTALEEKPAVLVNTSIWCHHVYAGLGIPRVLDAQNVDGRAIAERYGRHHPFTYRVRTVERRVVHESDLVFCCSELDAEHFAADYALPATKLRVAPNGIWLAEPGAEDPAAQEMARQLAGKHILFFMGKLDYAPNIEALAFLTNHLLPELECRRPGKFACVITGGPSLPDGIFHPHLHYAGQVPDVGPWMAMADICLAPIFSGSGTRLKILEYFAAGKTVVATAKAAEGIAAGHDRELVLAGKNDVASAVLQLADDPDRAKVLAERGRQLAEDAYSWERTAAIWREGLVPFLAK